MSNAGIIIYHLFIISGTHGLSSSYLKEALKNIDDPDHTIFTEETIPTLQGLICSISVVYVIQATAQTFLMIFANNNTLSYSNPTISWLCYFLAVCNFFKWADSSLTLSSVGHTNPIKELVFSRMTWLTISRFLFPMMLFYRLHSVHLLYEAGVKQLSDKPSETKPMQQDEEKQTSKA